MKNILSTLLLLFFILSCSPKINYIDGHKIIKFGTKEFENFEKSAILNKETAWGIYYEKKTKKGDPITHWLFFVIDKNYIFTAVIDPGKMKTELTGYSVNSETGEIKRINNEIKIKYENAYSLDTINSFSFPLKRKYRKKTLPDRADIH